jgi:hypothetical protein
VENQVSVNAICAALLFNGTNEQKNYHFKFSVKDDNHYDACRTVNIKILGREILQSGLQRITAVSIMSIG